MPEIGRFYSILFAVSCLRSPNRLHRDGRESGPVNHQIQPRHLTVKPLFEDRRSVARNQRRLVALAARWQHPDDLVAVLQDVIAALAAHLPLRAVLIVLGPPMPAIGAPVGDVCRQAVGAEEAVVLRLVPETVHRIAREGSLDFVGGELPFGGHSRHGSEQDGKGGQVYAHEDPSVPLMNAQARNLFPIGRAYASTTVLYSRAALSSQSQRCSAKLLRTSIS